MRELSWPWWYWVCAIISWRWMALLWWVNTAAHIFGFLTWSFGLKTNAFGSSVSSCFTTTSSRGRWYNGYWFSTACSWGSVKLDTPSSPGPNDVVLPNPSHMSSGISLDPPLPKTCYPTHVHSGTWRDGPALDCSHPCTKDCWVTGFLSCLLSIPEFSFSDSSTWSHPPPPGTMSAPQLALFILLFECDAPILQICWSFRMIGVHLVSSCQLVCLSSLHPILNWISPMILLCLLSLMCSHISSRLKCLKVILIIPPGCKLWIVLMLIYGGLLWLQCWRHWRSSYSLGSW